MTDYRITDKKAYGEMIDLTCRNHPELTWKTKNIDCIGARTIFYSYADNDHKNECKCSLSNLIVKET